jgi:voltage-gated potassium channel
LTGSKPDPWRQVRVALGALGGVLIGGTVAYRVVGLGLFDAFYQTLITISTVGFSEVGDNPGTAYRAVTMVVIIVGVGLALYTLGLFFEALMEGRIGEHVGRTRLQNALDQLQGHIILCGWGRVGQSIYATLRTEGADVVVVDRRPEVASEINGLAVVGEATDDAVLRRAGLERARGLVIALDSDADNMYVTLSGRSMNPDIVIVTRATTTSAVPKLRQAGADTVVNPHQIGGNRMASFMTQPNVADFLGEAMHDERFEVQLREFEVVPGTILEGSTIEESGLKRATGVTILAIKRPDGSFLHHPRADTTLQARDVPIVLGTSEQHRSLRKWVDESS